MILNSSIWFMFVFSVVVIVVGVGCGGKNLWVIDNVVFMGIFR